MFYGNCMKICEDFTLNFGDKRTGCCIMTMHCLTLPSSTKEFLIKNNTTVIPHPTYLPELAAWNFSVY
jgi:hypothetical protein